MNSHNTIDREELGDLESFEPKPIHRVVRILLEVVPLLVGIVGYFLGFLAFFVQMIILLTAIYVFAGWYIFKTDRYKAVDIIFTELSIIIFLTPSIFGILFKIMSWPGGDEITLIAVYGSVIYIFIALVWYLMHQTKLRKRFLGFHILGRIVFLTIFVRIFLFGTQLFY